MHISLSHSHLVTFIIVHTIQFFLGNCAVGYNNGVFAVVKVTFFLLFCTYIMSSENARMPILHATDQLVTMMTSEFFIKWF